MVTRCTLIGFLDSCAVRIEVKDVNKEEEEGAVCYALLVTAKRGEAQDMSDTKPDPGDFYDHLGNWNNPILRKIIFFVARGNVILVIHVLNLFLFFEFINKD